MLFSHIYLQNIYRNLFLRYICWTLLTFLWITLNLGIYSGSTGQPRSTCTLGVVFPMSTKALGSGVPHLQGERKNISFQCISPKVVFLVPKCCRDFYTHRPFSLFSFLIQMVICLFICYLISSPEHIGFWWFVWLKSNLMAAIFYKMSHPLTTCLPSKPCD